MLSDRRWNPRNVILSALLAAAFFFHDSPAVAGADLVNVSLTSLGATAKGTGSDFNKGWPANNALLPGTARGGTLMGPPMAGGRVDIHLILPVDIKAIEVLGLDYHGTRQPRAIDIFVDGKLLKHAELEENPGQPNTIPLEARGQNVGILITDEYPVRTLPDGTKGPAYGGWSRLRVLSTTDLTALLKPVDDYNVVWSPDNIAPTAANDVGGKVDVVGKPRETHGHPCTLWDNEDIAHYKEMLKSGVELQAQFDGLKRSMDVRITQCPGIPQPKQGPDGKWMHLSDKAESEGQTYGAIHNQLGLDIANLGAVYVLTGEPKYAEFCKTLLLAYADAYPNYGVGARRGFSEDPSKVFDQRLSDATWLIQVARGYDLIHDLPSIAPEQRKHIEDDLINADAQFIAGNHAMIEAATNWSAIATCSVLTAAYATDNHELLNVAFYGLRGGTKEKPTGGLFLKHFGSLSIAKDGMWMEGAMGYQFMALEALIMDAEILWHHGIDMYRYRDCALKTLFDSPLQVSYPDLTTPAIHDSGHCSVLGSDSFLYEYAYRRYRDPSYLLVLNQIGTHLDAHFQQFPVSILYDRDLKEGIKPVEWKSVNFFSVGYGILRNTTEAATNSLLLEYGPAGSHSHPDKLTLDLYAFNDQLSPDPGSVWYELPLYQQWYRTTLAHDTLVVDELDQIMTGAQQLVYGSAETMGIERAWTHDAYPGVTMDRSVFFTPNYVVDIFGAFARLPRKLDLAWHIRGQFEPELKMGPTTFPEPKENGYIALTNVQHTSTDKAWSAAVTRRSNVARFVAAGGTPTEIIVGNGHYGLETPPTIIERRMTNSTIYGNAIDFSGARDGYIKSVTQEGSLALGYGLLEVKTAKGTDLCFASYRPGTYKTASLETDAQQAFLLKDGKKVRSMFLGGGKLVKAAGATLQRSEPGLAYLEKTDTGGYLVANASASNAAVTIGLDALTGMDAFNLDANGKRTSAAAITKNDETTVTLQLNGLAKVEFAPKGALSQYDFREGLLRKRQADQEAALAKAREECIARTKVRNAEAKANPAPANTVLAVAAPAFSAQGGGTVTVVTTKRAAVGSVLSMWDSTGHWLEWTFDVPAEGYYYLTACYCSEMELIEREIQVNGEVQEPFAPMIFPSTGGWANGSDDWRLFTATDPVTKEPMLIKFKQGKNVVRLTNTNDRGININYIAITSPDIKMTREMLAAKLQQ